MVREFVLANIRDAINRGGGRGDIHRGVIQLDFVAEEDKRRMRKDRILDHGSMPVIGLPMLRGPKVKGYSE